MIDGGSFYDLGFGNVFCFFERGVVWVGLDRWGWIYILVSLVLLSMPAAAKNKSKI